jgi:succinate dehydrogenase flavin-adding protein (antitoxin of CptAB toxin-antitoxin module)
VEEIHGKVPEYAILSHTWDKQEMTLQDMHHSEQEKFTCFEKVDRCCKLVAKEGFEYVWIDTCCIDKTSSSELSEAINSMYRWYKEAQVCITYLSDVPSEEDPSSPFSSFRNCKWFTRGWTLQELIAPPVVEFYGKNAKGDWTEIGTKLSLQKIISEVTWIPIKVLQTGEVRDISLAKRMTWASKRETTREEDRAYSLMGLFDVNMPMLYGEGNRAFARLQEEIMKISNDHSLFAWNAAKEEVRHWSDQGLLADSPSDFVQSHRIERFRPLHGGGYQMTNLGLCMQLPLVEVDGAQCAVLNCFEESRSNYLLGIGLQRVSEGDERYARFDTNQMAEVAKEVAAKTEIQTIYIRRNSGGRFTEWSGGNIMSNISLSISPSDKSGYEVSSTYPAREDDGSIPARGRKSHTILGGCVFENKDAGKFAVIIGRYQGQPWCDIVTKIDQDIKAICYKHSYIGRSDRVNCFLPGRTSISVSIKKRGPKLKTEKDSYDEGYTLYIQFSRVLEERPK